MQRNDCEMTDWKMLLCMCKIEKTNNPSAVRDRHRLALEDTLARNGLHQAKLLAQILAELEQVGDETLDVGLFLGATIADTSITATMWAPEWSQQL